jgi:glycerophosphoryl diester phosphodiesterase
MKTLRPHTYIAYTLYLLPLLLSCTNPTPPMDLTQIDIQGHRGCRGLLPENTLPAFIKALDLGVNTLELDVVISGDGQVVVSHEPFFNHEISTGPEGLEITGENEKLHNLYEMSYDEIGRYDVGLKAHPRFPDQEKKAVHKPLLIEVIESAEEHAKATGRPAPRYNIETKLKPETDEQFHPGPEYFVELLMEVLAPWNMSDRITIQSFDPRTLQVIKRGYADNDLSLALLIENEDGLATNLDRLGFIPDIYSPWFKLVDEALVEAVHEKNMLLIPWTLNEVAEFERALNLGVDGIITDYPDRLLGMGKEK